MLQILRPHDYERTSEGIDHLFYLTIIGFKGIINNEEPKPRKNTTTTKSPHSHDIFLWSEVRYRIWGDQWIHEGSNNEYPSM